MRCEMEAEFWFLRHAQLAYAVGFESALQLLLRLLKAVATALKAHRAREE